MNVYQGHNRRQTGGSIWSTIQRGAKPFIMSMLSKLKPHAMNVGKKVASSALNAGTNLTLDALSEKLNKQSLKDTITNEVDKLKSEVHEKVSGYKRKYLDQEGSGHHKRRRISKPKANKMHKRKAPKSQKVHKQNRKGQRRIKKKSSKGITKRKRVVSKKAIKDIFG